MWQQHDPPLAPRQAVNRNKYAEANHVSHATRHTPNTTRHTSQITHHKPDITRDLEHWKVYDPKYVPSALVELQVLRTAPCPLLHRVLEHSGAQLA